MISRIPSPGSLFFYLCNFPQLFTSMKNITKLTKDEKFSRKSDSYIFGPRRRKFVKSILRSDAKMFIITIELCGRYLISEFREEKTPKLERLTRQKESLRCSPHLHLARLSHVLKTETSLFFLKTHY